MYCDQESVNFCKDSKIITLRFTQQVFLSGLYILQALCEYDSSLTRSPQQETLIYSAHLLISYLILLIPHIVVVLALSWREALMKDLKREKFKDILCTVMLGLLHAF